MGVDFSRDPRRLISRWIGPDGCAGAWCPHLGADLSVGQRVEGQIRCAYCRFDAAGTCMHILTGDKIPPGAAIFCYPAAEAWGPI
jgi:phenylpropionate dioxygenase-like ring-hydroxylating dioxygenase large terminal subunit